MLSYLWSTSPIQYSPFRVCLQMHQGKKHFWM
nr:MAG TPA: hypothetical protein [Caudoviricetes sp.]